MRAEIAQRARTGLGEARPPAELAVPWGRVVLKYVMAPSSPDSIIDLAQLIAGQTR